VANINRVLPPHKSLRFKPSLSSTRTPTTSFSPVLILALARPRAYKQDMQPLNPLEMPVILDVIASHLPDNDLARCLRVSKRWRDIFLRHRWRYMCRVFEKAGRNDYWRPHPQNLYNHCHLVQDLRMGLTVYWYYLCDHPNLRNLQISCYDNSQKDKRNKNVGTQRSAHS